MITLTGPSSYTVVTAGTPPTGGQALLASQFGLKYIDSVYVGLSNDGGYYALWTPTSATKNGVTAGILGWLAFGYGEASGDLSAITIRVTAIGR